jgi:hypothetical protein
VEGWLLRCPPQTLVDTHRSAGTGKGVRILSLLFDPERLVTGMKALRSNDMLIVTT